MRTSIYSDLLRALGENVDLDNMQKTTFSRGKVPGEKRVKMSGREKKRKKKKNEGGIDVYSWAYNGSRIISSGSLISVLYLADSLNTAHRIFDALFHRLLVVLLFRFFFLSFLFTVFSLYFQFSTSILSIFPLSLLAQFFFFLIFMF